MRIYVAAPLGELETARDIADHLALSGHAITSRWLHETEPGDCDPDDDDTRARILADNLVDVASAECVVAWTAAGHPRATYAEIGFALALGHRVVWLHSITGYGRCIADSHRCVTRVATPPNSVDYPALYTALQQVESELRYLRACGSVPPPAIDRIGT